jgi:PKD domain
MNLRTRMAKFAFGTGWLALGLVCAGAIAAGPALAEGGVGEISWQRPASGSVAAFTVSPAAAGSPSAFDASASTTADGSITAYHWNFGDGSSTESSTATIAHAYASAGSYTATLTETDTVDVALFGLHFKHQSQTAPVSHAVAVPAPHAPTPPTVPAPPPTVRIASGPLTIGPRGNAWVWVICPRSARAGCHGTVTIQLAGGFRARSKAHHVHAVAARCARGCRALGSATYQARAGQRIHVRVHMASFVRGLLARQHIVAIRLTVTSVAGGHTALSATTLSLRARRRARHQSAGVRPAPGGARSDRRRRARHKSAGVRPAPGGARSDRRRRGRQ